MNDQNLDEKEIEDFVRSYIPNSPRDIMEYDEIEEFLENYSSKYCQ